VIRGEVSSKTVAGNWAKAEHPHWRNLIEESPIDKDEWLVLGCGTFLRERKVSSWESAVFGTLEDGRWSVSTVLLS
jgi:hypothetical protein